MVKNFEILIPFEKSVSKEGKLTLFGGIASSSDIDRDNERMSKEVLPKIAKELVNATVFFNHDTKGLAVGMVKTAENRTGGDVYITVEPTAADGMKDVITQIQEGSLKSFSIGGRIKKSEIVRDEKLGKDVREIQDVEIYEVSVVGVPSNTHASIQSCLSKSFEPGDELKKDGGPESSGLGDGHHPDTAPVVKEMEPYTHKCHKCETETTKCFKCAEPFKREVTKHKEPDGDEEQHEKEAAARVLNSPEFKKAIDTAASGTLAELKKSYEADKTATLEKNKALEARIEILQKALDLKSDKIAKSKGLEASDAEGKKETDTQKAAPGFTLLRPTITE